MYIEITLDKKWYIIHTFTINVYINFASRINYSLFSSSESWSPFILMFISKNFKASFCYPVCVIIYLRAIAAFLFADVVSHHWAEFTLALMVISLPLYWMELSKIKTPIHMHHFLLQYQKKKKLHRRTNNATSLRKLSKNQKENLSIWDILHNERVYCFELYKSSFQIFCACFQLCDIALCLINVIL